MRRRRAGAPDRRLANGPGKLTQALAITGELDGVALDVAAAIRLEGKDASSAARQVSITPRIGISRATEWPLRFVMAAD